MAGLHNYAIQKIMPYQQNWNEGGLGGNAPDRARRDRCVAAAGRDTHKSTKKSGLQKTKISIMPYKKSKKLTCPSPKGFKFHIDPLTLTAPRAPPVPTPTPAPPPTPGPGKKSYSSVTSTNFNNVRRSEASEKNEEIMGLKKEMHKKILCGRTK